MLTLSGKAKQFLIALAKILIVAGAFYFIYSRLAHDSKLEWVRLADIFQKKELWWLVGLLLVLTVLNRFLEVLKWQALASWIAPLSLPKAIEQVMAAVTAAIFTPNGIGEYAAKTLYFEKAQARNIIFLNLICNGVQSAIAIVFGLAGLVVFNAYHPVLAVDKLLLILAGLAALALGLFAAKGITIKGYSLSRLASKINSLPTSIHNRNNFYALLRHLVLMHQYYLLFLLFGIQLPYILLMSTIAATYFIGASLPSFQFLDFAVKGSISLLFFSLLGVNEWAVLLVNTLIWLLNRVLPVIVGSYYVFRFKTLKPKATQH